MSQPSETQQPKHEPPRAKPPHHAKPDERNERKPHAPPHEPANEGSGQPQPASAEQELERLRQEVDRAKEQYLRAVADVDNTKKRLHREKEEFIRFAAESMVRELLPIVDGLDQALIAVDKQADPEAVAKGVHLLYRQLLGLLAKEGVKRIPTVGERFDPHRHEAVAQVEAGAEIPEGTVVEEIQVGYTMHDRVIRPALVKVAKQTAPTETPTDHVT